MGSSNKKKKEKAQDFKKTKLKVGKTRPKNTNATDTSFAAKSIVLKQQTLSESGRDTSTLFTHNLSLLASKNDVQRKEALAYLATAMASNQTWPTSISVVLTKAQPLILDGTSGVRQQLLKFLKVLPASQLGPLDQTLLYTRAGMSHLSTDIRLSALDVLDWLLEISPEAVVSCAGGWIKTLKTFQNLLSWTGSQVTANGITTTTNGKWSASKPASSLGNNKLLVHQLSTLSTFLNAGLRRATYDPNILSAKTAAVFPLWHTEAHVLPAKGNCFGYLNLFGAPRDLESEMYDDPEERIEVLVDSGLYDAFVVGVGEAKKEGGEVGRAAAGVVKALKLAEHG